MISADSHIIELQELWTRWLAPEFVPAPLGLVTVTRGRPPPTPGLG